MKSMRGLIDVEPARPLKTSSVDWDSLDWRYSNDVLARQIGSSGTTVAKMRKDLGKPKSSIFNHNPGR